MPTPAPYPPSARYPITGDNLAHEAVSIPQRFEQMVEQNPDKVAVLRDDDALTYAQLNRLTNRLAHAIRAASGPAPAAVLIVFDRSPTVIAAIMGVLKAGKFYVPIDMADPPARLALIAADSQAELIVTEDACLPLARSLASAQSTRMAGLQSATAKSSLLPDGCPVLNLDALDPLLPDTNLGLPLRLADLAQIMYTSGSTGAPKGVIYTHDTVLHYIRTRNVDPRASPLPSDRTMMFTSLSVLGGSARIYWAVLTGGSLAVYNLKAKGLAGFADWLRTNDITLYQSSPTVFRHFVATLPGPLDLPLLRCVKLIGEPVARQDVELFKKYFPPPCLLQVTIATTECRAFAEYIAGDDTDPAPGRALLGYAAYDAQVAIWDDEGRDCGCEQVGEIVVRSEYLARGYWRRPDLTASVFLPDPAGGSARLYRTGDLGLLRADGMLEYVGRRDQQLKIRGNRIEVGEIESVLRAVPGVTEAAVAAHDDPRGEKQLVAYLQAPHPLPAAADLRARLLRRLPPHMLPAAFVRLDTLPLTVSGKVDRMALLAPDWSALDSAGVHVAARDAQEAQLVTIWERVLGHHPIGVHDDFFDLGGDSLDAAALVLQVTKVFGRALSPAVLLAAPTVAQLAVNLRAGDSRAIASSIVPIQPHGTRPPLFFAHGFGGGVLGYTPLARLLGGDQPAYGIQDMNEGAPVHSGTAAAPATFEAQVSRYVADLLAFQPAGPYYLAGYSYGGAVAFEMAQQLRAQGHTVALLAIFDYPPPRSHYKAFTLGPRFVGRCAANFPYWLREFVRLGGRGMAVRARNRLRYWLKPLRQLLKRAPEPQFELTDVVEDDARLPPAQRTHMLRQALQLRSYHPRRYDGRITLFRARAQSLVCSFDPLLGWGELAPGAVDCYVVAGSHHSLLLASHVAGLARALRACLHATPSAGASPAT